MRKTIKTIALAALCLNFTSKAIAQEPIPSPANKAIDVTKKGIRIGEKVPETAALAKYKGKPIILDFWATWCGPCVAMIPKMEKLQEQFKGQIKIITVTYQSESVVRPFLERVKNGRNGTLTEITGDTVLKKLFPHIYLPHYVWIDSGGTIAAITGAEEINAENVQKFLIGGSKGFKLTPKQDMKLEYDATKPFLISKNGGSGDNMQYHSVLTGYTEGLGAGATVRNRGDFEGRKISVRNLSISWLFKIAYGEGTMRFHNEANVDYQLANKSQIHNPHKDPVAFTNWAKENTYCYELIVPVTLRGKVYSMMKEDLQRLFPQYEAMIKKQEDQEILIIRDKSNPKN